MSVEKKEIDVVVIGAGLSGLTMTHRLNQKGYNVFLYEARPRVGGRIQTIYVKNSNDHYSLAELGGQNITDGGDAKHFLNLCQELSLGIEEKYIHLSRGFYDHGKLYNSKALLENYSFSKHNLKETLQTLSSSATTIADVLDQLFSKDLLLKRIISYFIGSYEGLPPEDLAIIHNIETLEYLLLGGVAAAHKNEEVPETFLLKSLQGGNSKLPLALAQSLGKKIHLNKALEKVSYHENKINLGFKDRTSVICDKLILAIPCPVFKNIEWHKDLIPPEILGALNHVQYGSNGKIIIPFTADNRPMRYSSVSSDHAQNFFNNDDKLMVLYTDKIWGKNLETQIQSYYPHLLKMIESNYGKQPFLSIPIPTLDHNYQKYDQPVLKSWQEDSYAQGSYSAVGAVLGKRFLAKTVYKNVPLKTIFVPLNDQIFFIGEHTSLIDEAGTMEAAIESAERISCLF